MAEHLRQPNLLELTRRFLFDQLQPSNADLTSQDVSEDDCPVIMSKVDVYHSAVATFYAPSDESGLRGMKRERNPMHPKLA